MTLPEFTPVVEYVKRDPSEFLPWRRCAERKTQSGQVIPGKLLIVRPLEAIDDYRELSEEQKAKKARGEEVWRGKLIVVDVALLDELPHIPDDGMGNELLGFKAGTIFRNNTVKLGFLNKAFRDFVGNTCIGTLYTQPSRNKDYQPSIHWRDLAGDPAAVTRGRSFLQAFPDFLIPVKGQFVSTESSAAPVSGASQGSGYQQPDPWAQGGSGSVTAATGHPNQGLSTLQQLKNAQGAAQEGEPPF